MCLSPENWNETMLKPSIAKRFPAEPMGPQNIFGLPCHPLEITWINHQHSSTKPSLFFQLGAYASIGSIGSIDHVSLSVFCMPPSCAMELLELLEPAPWFDWSSHVVACFALLLAALHVSLTKSGGVGSMGHGVAYDSPSCGAAIRSMYAPCINIITLYLSIFNYIYIYSFLLIWPPKIACTDVDSFDENNRRMQGSFWSIFSQVTLGLAWLLERRQQKHMTLRGQFQAFWRGASESSNENLGNEPVSRNLGGVWLYAPTYFILFFSFVVIGPLWPTDLAMWFANIFPHRFS